MDTISPSDYVVKDNGNIFCEKIPTTWTITDIILVPMGSDDFINCPFCIEYLDSTIFNCKFRWCFSDTSTSFKYLLKYYNHIDVTNVFINLNKDSIKYIYFVNKDIKRWKTFILKGNKGKSYKIDVTATGQYKTYTKTGTYTDTLKTKIFNRDSIITIHILNGINDPTAIETLETNIKVFPNPCTTKLHITGVSNTNILLFDLNGKLLLNKQTNTETIIETNNLKIGLYILKINNKSYKILKQ